MNADSTLAFSMLCHIALADVQQCAAQLDEAYS